MIPSSILIMENVFITPLAEADDKGQMMKHILYGIILMSVPVAIFTMAYSKQIVKVALERGVFTSASTGMTADALWYFAIAIPAFFLNPITYRLFQILGRLRGISIVGIFSVISNAGLNYLFLEMGHYRTGLGHHDFELYRDLWLFPAAEEVRIPVTCKGGFPGDPYRNDFGGIILCDDLHCSGRSGNRIGTYHNRDDVCVCCVACLFSHLQRRDPILAGYGC
jgi:hypothetical protein